MWSILRQHTHHLIADLGACARHCVALLRHSATNTVRCLKMLRQLILSSCFQIFLQGLEELKHNLSQERNIEKLSGKNFTKILISRSQSAKKVSELEKGHFQHLL